jgi:hypothetical protein
MKRPSFFEGVGVALAASLAGGILYAALSPILTNGGVLRLLIAGIGLAYVIYLLRRTHERIGRITTLAAWIVAAVVTWATAPPLIPYVLVHVGLVWLIRSLYFYSSPLSALADLGLHGLALAAGVWALTHTGSLLLALWCFFLVQALFVAIPPSMNDRTPGGAPDAKDNFQHAYRAAEAALRKLSSAR